MCFATHYISRNCGHHWLAIRQACWPGYGFTYCGVFGDGVAREPSPEYEVVGLCPACASPGGYYDRNLVRMVVDIREKCRWGAGPSRDELLGNTDGYERSPGKVSGFVMAKLVVDDGQPESPVGLQHYLEDPETDGTSACREIIMTDQKNRAAFLLRRINHELSSPLL